MNGQYAPGDVVFGRWTLTRLIGEGSFGRVYEARREDFGVTYRAAVKIITIPRSQSEVRSARAEGMDDQSVTSYFQSLVEEMVREFELMSRLKGTANIVGYEDHEVVPHSEGIGWDILIRMELLTPLVERIQREGLGRRDVLRLGIDLCRALELCRKHGIIHRDIKPENIFLSDNGDYKLGDFGIARTAEKTTGGLSKKGTYTYMAPEVYREQPYGPSADLYSLGIVLYRLLNGNRAPFLPPAPAPITHAAREDALARRMGGEPLPPPRDAEGPLAEAVLRACAYDPARRYASPAQLRQDLEAILGGQPEPERPAAPQAIESGAPTERTESVFHLPSPVFDSPAEEQTERTESVFHPPLAQPAAEAGRMGRQEMPRQPAGVPAGAQQNTGGRKFNRALFLLSMVCFAAAILIAVTLAIEITQSSLLYVILTSGPGIFGSVPICAVFGVMFFVLARSEADSPYLLGRTAGLKKKTFLVICIALILVLSLLFNIIA